MHEFLHGYGIWIAVIAVIWVSVMLFTSIYAEVSQTEITAESYASKE